MTLHEITRKLSVYKLCISAIHNRAYICADEPYSGIANGKVFSQELKIQNLEAKFFVY